MMATGRHRPAPGRWDAAWLLVLKPGHEQMAWTLTWEGWRAAYGLQNTGLA